MSEFWEKKMREYYCDPHWAFENYEEAAKTIESIQQENAALKEQLKQVRRETLEEAAERFDYHCAGSPLCDGEQIAKMLIGMANETD